MIFNRSFRFTFESATADQFDADGNNWDSLDAPDMFGEIQLDGSTVLTTPTVDNSLVATWGTSDDITLTPTALCFLVYDVDDWSFNDLMDGTCWNSASGIVNVVRAGGHNGDLFDNEVAVEVTVSPNF